MQVLLLTWSVMGEASQIVLTVCLCKSHGGIQNGELSNMDMRSSKIISSASCDHEHSVRRRDHHFLKPIRTPVAQVMHIAYSSIKLYA
jgi:hypothetical protein